MADDNITPEERVRLRADLQELWSEMNKSERVLFLIECRLAAAGVPDGPTRRDRMAAVPERRQEMTRILMDSLFDAKLDAMPGDVNQFLGAGLS